MNLKAEYWFTIEPHVHISLKNERFLLYNTKDGSRIESSDNQLYQLVERVAQKQNMRVVKIGNAELSNKTIVDFINEVRTKYIGDVIDVSLSSAKPIQVPPILNIQQDVKRLSAQPEGYFGKNILGYLHELSLVITGSCEQSCPHCTTTYEQLLHCTKQNGRELPLAKVKDILAQAASSSLFKVNILGGNIWSYSQLTDLASLLGTYKSLKVVLHNHILNTLESTISLPDNISLNLFVDFAHDGISTIEENIQSNIARYPSSSFTFTVSNEGDLAAANALIEKFDLKNYSYKPFFKESSLSFFKENVFLNEEDIFGQPISMKQLFANMAINTNKFGIAYVDCKGNVYADLQKEPVGNMGKERLADCLFNELTKGSSWLDVRDSEVCNECLYQYLCPPPSSYEGVIGKPNLCNVVP